jgi:ribosomal protein S18 acetylase RimI-like enzyme
LSFVLPEPGDPHYASELDLRYRVLREPLGMRRDQVTFPFEDEALHLVALDGDTVVGCVLFHRRGDSGRLFQMAVDPSLQGRGLGARLVRHLEARLAGDGVREVVLHARDLAIGFYEKLGYESFGEPYVEVGIPHRSMRKALSASTSP